MAGWVHLSNRQYLRVWAPEMLREDITVMTRDDASYLVPVENFLSGKGWRSNAAGSAAYTTRSPGYGLCYLVFRAFLSPRAALIGLFAFQVFLFSLVVSLLPRLGTSLGLPIRMSFVFACVIACMPTFSGFLSYTLTEGVSPSLVLLFLVFLLRGAAGSVRYFRLAVLILGILLLIRPAMLVWVLTIPLLLMAKGGFLLHRRHLWFVAVAFLPLLFWQVWAFAKTDSLVGLHPIYHTDSNGLYRPLHRDIWNFHKSWGQEGVVFHRDIGGLWADALEGSNPDDAINALMESIPASVVEVVGEPSLRNAYRAYYFVLKKQRPYYLEHKPMPGVGSEEAALSQTFQRLRSQYVASHWFFSNVVVPIQVYQRLGFHSNLSLYLFQKPLRGKSWMEGLRYVSGILYSGIFLLFPLVLLRYWKHWRLSAIGWPVAVYLAYLCVVQRGIEERYVAPVLVPMTLFILVCLCQWWQHSWRVASFAPNEN